MSASGLTVTMYSPGSTSCLGGSCLVSLAACGPLCACASAAAPAMHNMAELTLDRIRNKIAELSCLQAFGLGAALSDNRQSRSKVDMFL